MSKTTNILSVIKERSKDDLKTETQLITFLNPHSYKIARKNIDAFKEIDRIYIDGISLVKLLNMFKIGKHTRKSFDMSSLAGKVFNGAIRDNKTIYLIGTEPDKIDEAISVIKANFQKLNIIGFRNGFFNNIKEREETLQNIISLKPDIVICGMGTPLQEQFLIDLKSTGWKGTGYTCGGFLHQIIDGINYFPSWANKYNLRWFYRMINEPEVITRHLKSFTIFPFVFIFDYLKYKKES